MRRNEDHNLLKRPILESATQYSLPCDIGHMSAIQLFANQYVSEYCVRLLRPISRSLLLARLSSRTGQRRDYHAVGGKAMIKKSLYEELTIHIDKEELAQLLGADPGFSVENVEEEKGESTSC
jgi:hypothetical protein